MPLAVAWVLYRIARRDPAVALTAALPRMMGAWIPQTERAPFAWRQPAGLLLLGLTELSA